eukprot:1194761-Prorocentrum_minimum.AAC.7
MPIDNAMSEDPGITWRTSPIDGLVIKLTDRARTKYVHVVGQLGMPCADGCPLIFRFKSQQGSKRSLRTGAINKLLEHSEILRDAYDRGDSELELHPPDAAKWLTCQTVNGCAVPR